MTSSLTRFHLAQDATGVGFASAHKELQTSGKSGHWIWYIFPQLAGLGASPEARLYGLHGREEALEYFRDPLLQSRLIGITHVVAQRLLDGVPLTALMGSRTDALKLVSSLTLFETINQPVEDDEGAGINTEFGSATAQVLAAAEAQGYARCQYTLSRLGKPTAAGA